MTQDNNDETRQITAIGAIMPVLAVVDDLFLLSKIQQTATLTNTRLEVIKPGELAKRVSQGGVSAVICDLNHRSGTVLDAIRQLNSDASSRVPLIGFVSHVQADLIDAARRAGCDTVMARSAFVAQLPQILRQYAEPEAAFPPAP